MIFHSVEYTEYIQSDKWRSKCRNLKNKRGHVCERCGCADWPLDVHHLTYDRLGHEIDDDLLIVCKTCHPIVDRERERREADRRFQRRCDAWARKVYGRLWRLFHSPDDVIEEFYQWQKQHQH